MELPLQITFHRLTRSDALAIKVRQRAQKLEQRFDGILSCRVSIEALDRTPCYRKQLRVRLEVGLAGGQVVVTQDADEHTFDPDGFVAISEAFRAMRRKLEDQRAVPAAGALA